MGPLTVFINGRRRRDAAFFFFEGLSGTIGAKIGSSNFRRRRRTEFVRSKGVFGLLKCGKYDEL